MRLLGAALLSVALLAARDDDDLLVLGATGLLWESQDGADFVPLASLPASNHVDLVAGDAAHYAATATGDVSRSTDGGMTWTLMGTANVDNAVGLAAAEDALFLLTEPGEVASSPGGEAWIWTGTVNQVDVTSLASDQPVSSVPDPGVASVAPALLGPPWPNPLPGRDAAFSVPVRADRAVAVRIVVYDTSGRRVAETPMTSLRPGDATIQVDAGHLPAGRFFARMRTLDGWSKAVALTRLR